MQKVVEFLQKNPVQYLATVGRDGKANNGKQLKNSFHPEIKANIINDH